VLGPSLAKLKDIRGLCTSDEGFDLESETPRGSPRRALVPRATRAGKARTAGGGAARPWNVWLAPFCLAFAFCSSWLAFELQDRQSPRVEDGALHHCFVPKTVTLSRLGGPPAAPDLPGSFARNALLTSSGFRRRYASLPSAGIRRRDKACSLRNVGLRTLLHVPAGGRRDHSRDSEHRVESDCCSQIWIEQNRTFNGLKPA
jgi:hypothetical protein